MILLVCGGRDFDDDEFLERQLNSLKPRIKHLVTGCATGADKFALEWANKNRISHSKYFADWDKLGKAAGYARNADMLKFGKPTHLLAMPGGPGTAMMLDLATKAGLKKRVFKQKDVV